MVKEDDESLGDALAGPDNLWFVSRLSVGSHSPLVGSVFKGGSSLGGVEVACLEVSHSDQPITS